MTNYQGIYINLARSSDRDIYIRSHLASLQMLECFKRFEAVDGVNVQVPSGAKINAFEMACYDSHLQAMQEGEGKHIHIIEDDVQLSQNFRFVLQPFLDFQDDKEWDIIFFGVNVPIAKVVYDLLLVGERGQNRFKLFDLQPFGSLYSGCHSYIINHRSVSKITALLDENKYDLAVDLKLRNYIFEGKIKAFVTLPLLAIPLPTLFDTTILERVSESTMLLPREHIYLAQKLVFADTLGKHKELYTQLQQYLLEAHNLVTKQPLEDPSFEEVVAYFVQSVQAYRKR